MKRKIIITIILSLLLIMTIGMSAYADAEVIVDDNVGDADLGVNGGNAAEVSVQCFEGTSDTPSYTNSIDTNAGNSEVPTGENSIDQTGNNGQGQDNNNQGNEGNQGSNSNLNSDNDQDNSDKQNATKNQIDGNNQNNGNNPGNGDNSGNDKSQDSENNQGNDSSSCNNNNQDNKDDLDKANNQYAAKVDDVEEPKTEVEILTVNSNNSNTDTPHTINFTYNEQTTCLPVGSLKKELSQVLSNIGIKELIASAIACNDEECASEADENLVKDGETVLFKVYEENNTWFIDSLNPFDTTHGLLITTNIGQYKVKVTDPCAVSYVARIGDNLYETVQDAVNDAVGSATPGTAENPIKIVIIADSVEGVEISVDGSTPYITLDLNGYVLDAKNSDNYALLVDGGILNIVDGNAENTHTGAYEDLPKGGIITGAKSTGIYIKSSTVNLYGGTIYKNGTSSCCGGVEIYTGTFNMYGGCISNNNSGYSTAGGGVYVHSGDNKNHNIFNMYGGSITENKASFTKIPPPTMGGGVYNADIFNMYGGSITRNTANGKGTLIGGVYNAGTFNMYGGEITGNNGNASGGVYNSGTMTVGGKTVISGNTLTNGTTCSDLYLPSGTVTISEDTPFISGASIGITLPAASYPSGTGKVDITSNNPPDSNNAQYFFSDNTNYTVSDDTGKVVLGIDTRTALTVTGTTVSPKQYDGTTAVASEKITIGTITNTQTGETVTVTINASAIYADKNVGNDKTVTIIVNAINNCTLI